MSNKWHNYFQIVARETAKLSYCVRKKVGAVAVRDNRIILCGYNGTPAGADNCCEDVIGIDFANKKERLETKPEVSHAEENLITYAAQTGIPLKGCSLYITLAPCIHCAKLIKNAGISNVIYEESYGTEGIEYLEKYGVSVLQMKTK